MGGRPWNVPIHHEVITRSKTRRRRKFVAQALAALWVVTSDEDSEDDRPEVHDPSVVAPATHLHTNREEPVPRRPEFHNATVVHPASDLQTKRDEPVTRWTQFDAATVGSPATNVHTNGEKRGVVLQKKLDNLLPLRLGKAKKRPSK